MHLQSHTCVHTYTQMWMCMHVCVCVCVCIFLSVCEYVRVCVCACLYEWLCVRVYVYMCMCMHMYVCIHVSTWVFLYICVWFHVNICTHILLDAYICTCTNTYTCTYTHTHTRTRTRVHTYIHTHTCTHPHTHTHTQTHPNTNTNVDTHIHTQTHPNTNINIDTHIHTRTHIRTNIHTHLYTIAHRSHISYIFPMYTSMYICIEVSEAERPKSDGCIVTRSMLQHVGRIYCHLCSTVFRIACFLFVHTTFLIELPSLQKPSRYPHTFEFNVARISCFGRFLGNETFLLWPKKSQRYKSGTHGSRTLYRDLFCCRAL